MKTGSGRRYFRDHRSVGESLFDRPLEWRLGVQLVAINPSAAFRKALRMWLPPDRGPC
ncbi:hypothetical protein HNP00_003008 [Arthrobacter sp. AZCC_0090]|nr:hypothetical protein [Arthrobacter sp. AZCC_0090]